GVGCGNSGGGSKSSSCELQRPADYDEPFDRLKDYCFFGGQPAKQHLEPSKGVYPYGVRSKLYSDESDKFRFIVPPEGETIDYDDRQMWSFPDGTIIVKTFYFPHDARNPSEGRRLLETRLMMKEEGKWKPRVYLWNEKETKAERWRIGTDREVTWTNEEGKEVTTNYRVPSENKCKSCHQRGNVIELLGPRTRQLNRPFEYASGKQNQIRRFAEAGLLDDEPGSVDDLPKLADPKNEELPIEARARAYLEGNCAHCHDPKGGASNSGLFLGIEQEDPNKLGVCKRTVAAGAGTGGHEFDIVPGHPEKSIMIFRMKSSDPEIKMPELPLRTVDTFGVKVVSEWIRSMEERSCGE
ncbi:MAG: SO2930 family diheme c-type cytochrome, partial [Bradymonadaceae bacterium]